MNSNQPMRLTAFLFFSIVAGACGDSESETSSTANNSDIPDPVCEELLTPADFQSVCGAELTMTPTMFEGLEGNPCNRTAPANEALMLVTRHPSASVASNAESVAGGRGPNAQSGLGLHASAGSKGIFMVEVKATDDSAAVCSPDKLPLLLDIALSRITAEGS